MSSSFDQLSSIYLDHLSLLPFFMANGRPYSRQGPIPLIFRLLFFGAPLYLYIQSISSAGSSPTAYKQATIIHISLKRQKQIFT